MSHKFSYPYYEFTSVITFPELNNNIRYQFTLKDRRRVKARSNSSSSFRMFTNVRCIYIYIHAYVVLTVWWMVSGWTWIRKCKRIHLMDQLRMELERSVSNRDLKRD